MSQGTTGFDTRTRARYLSAAFRPGPPPPEVPIVRFLLVLPVLVISMVAHEYAHGYAALRQGDNTAKLLGRLTLNPLKHIDPWLSLLLPAMLWFGSGGSILFGGAKPVPVNPRNYRQYRRSDIIVSMAGIVTNLGLVVVFGALAFGVGVIGEISPAAPAVWAGVQEILFWGVWFNLLLANFNLIPIPPLDGSHVLAHFLPPHAAVRFRELSQYGFLILLGLVFFVPRLLLIVLIPSILALRAVLALLGPYQLAPFGIL